MRCSIIFELKFHQSDLDLLTSQAGSSSSVANCLSFARKCGGKKKILLCRFDQCLCRDEHKLPIENSQKSLNCAETIRRRAAGSRDYLTAEGRLQLFVKYFEQNTEKGTRRGKTEMSEDKLSSRSEKIVT